MTRDTGHRASALQNWIQLAANRTPRASQNYNGAYANSASAQRLPELPRPGSSMTDLLCQSHGHGWIRVRRIHRARSRAAAGSVRAHGLRRCRASSQQERDAACAGRRQFHHQRRARQLRAEIRACARTFRLRDGLSRERRRGRAEARDLARRETGDDLRGPDGAEHSGDRRHRRQSHLSGGSLRRAEHLRCRLSPHGGRPGERACGAHRDRSPDAQRAPRQYECVGGLLRADLQFPRDPLLRHRGTQDGALQPRDDESLRQDPHSDQRIAGRQVADRGVPEGISRRRHPAHRARDARHHRRASTC